MRAAVFQGPNHIEIQEITIPEPNEKAVLAKILACAVCGYDARVYRNGHAKVIPPVILGHEICGVINETIYLVDGDTIKAGSRVAIMPTVPCLECTYCQRSQYNLCSDLRELGSSVNGGFAEYMAIPDQVAKIGGIVAVPDNLHDEDGALLEPLACCINGFENFRGINRTNLDKTFTIIGDGPIGLLQLQLAKLYGFRTAVIGKIDSRLFLAKALGADIIIRNNDYDEVVREILDFTSGLGTDYIVVAANDPTSLHLITKIAAKNSQIQLFAGLPKGSAMSVDCNWIHYNQISLLGSFSSTVTSFRKAALLAAREDVDLHKIVGNTYPLEGIGKAMTATQNYDGLRAVVNKY